MDRDYKPILDLKGQKVLVFSPDNQKIIALCSDKIIKIWNRYGKLLRTIPAHEESITSLSVSPDSQIIASGSVDRTVKLWDFDGQLLQTLEGHGDTILHVSFSSNGQKIASASNDRIIRIWKQVQNSNNNLVTILRKPSSRFSPSPTYDSLSFSPNGHKVAAINTDYNGIDIWVDKTENLRLFPQQRNKRIVSINFSPDSQGILWTNGDSIKFRDFNTRVTTTINQSDVNNINFAPNKDQFAAGSEDGTITTWHRDGRLIKTFMAHTEGITTITFSPDGKIIASGSYDDTIKLWTNDGKPLKTMIGHNSNVRDLAFSPDGKIIASASEDQTVRLWNRSGVLLKVLQGHQNAVWSVDFSPDGKTIASASIDGTIRLWSRSGKLLNTLKGHKGAIWDIRYSPNKNKQILVSYGSNKSVRLWNLDFYDLIEWSCDWLHDYLVTNSNVTEQELDYCPITK